MTTDNEITDAEPLAAKSLANGFAAFGLNAKLFQGVEDAGFLVPSPIQQQAIPVILEGRDVIGQAHTGTGKTAAFGLPGMNMLKGSGSVEILVVTPTRELTTQVGEELYRLGKHINVKTAAIYGGQPYSRQIESVKRGAQIVVATPGRLLDLLKGGSLKQHFKPWLVILDEADEMLDMGFLDDVKKIFTYLPEERQTLLFSATVPKPIQVLAEQILKDPVTIRVDRKEPTSSDIQQYYYVIDEHERDAATLRLIDSMEPTRAIIFCRTKREVDRLAGTLASQGQLSQPLHGDMEQPMRERVIAGFKTGDFQILVATDVAARGLDINDVSHVFNYHIPFDTESYVHRIGRTGRAGRTGVAVTLVTPREYHDLTRLQTKIGRMQHRLIPSHQELQEANEVKMLEAIRSMHIDTEAERFLHTLEEEMGLAQAAHKMVALLMNREAVAGPDQIGLQGPQLDRLASQTAQRTANKKAGGGKFGRSSRPFGKKPGGPPSAGGPKGYFGKGAKPKPSFSSAGRKPKPDKPKG